MMRLRTTVGVQQEEYEKQFLLPFGPLEENLERCVQENLAVRTNEGRYYLTPRGFLVSNAIISDLLLLQEQSEPLAKRRT